MMRDDVELTGSPPDICKHPLPAERGETRGK